MDPQALFFDAAGTLVHLAEPVGQTYARFAGEYGLAANPSQLEAAFRSAWKASPPPLHPEDGPPTDDDRAWWLQLVRTTFEKANGAPISPQVVDALFPDLYAHFAKPDAWILYEDVLPTLMWLAGRYRMLILSNFDGRLRGILEGHGLASYFEKIIVSSEVGASKPHPRMFQAALGAVGLAATACLHVGDDSKADHAGATQAGIGSFLLDRPRMTLAGLRQILS